ncbi:glutaminase GtaA [Xylogone sp. PMI_703]|nr:glutaminase GtaA [Xylogone sp. PMI_703]
MGYTKPAFLVAAATALFAIAQGQGQSTFSPARPPSIPLAVKSPYLSTWLPAGSDGGNGGYLVGEWPQFWTILFVEYNCYSGETIEWAGMIRVDNAVYTWMGVPTNDSKTADQVAFEYTSTRSTFVMNVGGLVQMNITFLSPVTPNDIQKQTLIFSYLDVAVESSDGKEHDVQLYVDTSADWAAGDKTSPVQWDYGTTGKLAYHKFYPQNQLLVSETNQQPDWGYWYWATETASHLTHQSGKDTDVRGSFVSEGKLDNSKDTNFGSPQDTAVVFGFALDLGSITASTSTLFTIGLTQEIAIQFASAGGVEYLPSLWTSYFSDELDSVSFFYNDYDHASSAATSFDNQVAADALAAGGNDYVTITSLSARQAFGALQPVGNKTKQYIFMKEISSDGNVNTVDVVFPLHPVLLYTNPVNLKLLLDPLFENQESGQYPNTYSMHDLGSSYPNATGHPDGKDEAQPLEECGNMLVMTLAYAQRTSDVSYLSAHYDILNQWTQYLIQEALIPANQISTDDFAGSLANQTNLALKGIIGIEAMATIADLTGNSADAKNYTDIAHDYISQWQVLGIAHDANPPHTTLGYGLNDTHGLLYNLYADTELNLGLVPQSIYDMQSAFYPTVEDKYGVALDTRHNYTKSDWQMFTAAISSSSTKEMFISDLAKFINETPTSGPLTDLYDAQTGDWPIDAGQFRARPVVGGHFALMALQGMHNTAT